MSNDDKQSPIPRHLPIKRMIGLLVLALLAPGFILLIPDPPVAPLVSIELGLKDFHQTIWFDGTVEAKDNTEVQAPDSPYDSQLSFLAEEGTTVQKGDVVARFDKSKVTTKLLEVHEEKRAVQNEAENITHNAELEISLLETEIFKKQNERDIYALDKETLAFAQQFLKDMADLKYSMSSKTLTASETRMIGKTALSQEKLRAQEKQIKEWKKRERKTEAYLAEYEIKAPMDSIVIHKYVWTAHTWKKVEEGDILSRRTRFVSLPDLSSLVVVLEVEERVIDQLYQGATVTFFPISSSGDLFTGTVEAISTLAVEGEFNALRKFFEVTVAITPNESDNQELLKPGMIVRAEVLTKKWDNVLAIPHEYAANDGTNLTIHRWTTETDTIEELVTDKFTTIPDYYLIEPSVANSSRVLADTDTVTLLPPDLALEPDGWLASMLMTLKRNIPTPAALNNEPEK